MHVIGERLRAFKLFRVRELFYKLSANHIVVVLCNYNHN